MKLAVTGASGFVGRHVLRALVVQNLQLAQPVQIIATFRTRRYDLPKLPFVRWKQFDLANDVRHACEILENPNLILHLAWAGLPNYCSEDHLKLELPRHLDFMQAMIESDLDGISVAGTCYEYGLQSGSLSEDLPATPTNAYGQAKNILRCSIEKLLRDRDIGFTWFRLFYLYGADQPARTLYAQLKQAIEENRDVFNMSGGNQIRDYLSIDRASQLIAERVMKLTDSGIGDGIVNIASGNGRSVRSIVKQWISEEKSSIRPNYGAFPYPAHEPMEFWADTTKLNSLSTAK